ncbi:hypothetical protein DD606_26300 [Enterobacter cloacae complex sp. GF14B]|nr:hypothetical protein DD606_26300 [Enterobacter cloacae complex sp. GF14B]
MLTKQGSFSLGWALNLPSLLHIILREMVNESVGILLSLKLWLRSTKVKWESGLGYCLMLYGLIIQLVAQLLVICLLS